MYILYVYTPQEISMVKPGLRICDVNPGWFADD